LEGQSIGVVAGRTIRPEIAHSFLCQTVARVKVLIEMVRRIGTNSRDACNEAIEQLKAALDEEKALDEEGGS
jgi:hypothetical protein